MIKVINKDHSSAIFEHLENPRLKRILLTYSANNGYRSKKCCLSSDHIFLCQYIMESLIQIEPAIQRILNYLSRCTLSQTSSVVSIRAVQQYICPIRPITKFANKLSFETISGVYLQKGKEEFYHFYIRSSRHCLLLEDLSKICITW